MSSLDVSAILENLSIIIGALAPLLCGLTYLLVLLCARRIWIYRRNNSHLHAYAKQVKSHLVTEQRDPQKQSKVEEVVKPEIEHLLAVALNGIPETESKFVLRDCLSLAGVGKQLAAWRIVHDADRLVTDLWPDEHVAAHAVVSKEKLKTIGTAPASTLSESIANILDKENIDFLKLKAMVKEARELIFDARDNYFEQLADWQNRAAWLVIVATALAILLATVFGDTIYMLLGATGGLLARLSKAMNVKTKGFDYGISWSMLFLAPVVGALTGWAGIQMSEFVIALNVISVPESLYSQQSAQDTAKVLTESTRSSLALLFGFSATLFESAMSGAITALKKQPESSGS